MRRPRVSEEDPLTKAMLQEQEKKTAAEQQDRTHKQKSEQRLREIMPPLKEKIRAAPSSIGFFDGGVSEVGMAQPVNATTSAIEAFKLAATRKNPQYQATVVITVTYDYAEPPSIGVHLVKPTGVLTRSTGHKMVKPRHAPFNVPLKLEQDGMLSLERDLMVESLTAAVHVLESGGGEMEGY